MKSYLDKLTYILMIFVILSGCSNEFNTSSNEQNNKIQIEKMLEGIYSYEYNSIEPRHKELINEWLSDIKNDPILIHSHSITNGNEGYEYLYAKGYKNFEVSFVYSVDDVFNKGRLHFVGNKGSAEDEILVKVKYDTRYVLGTVISDKSLFKP